MRLLLFLISGALQAADSAHVPLEARPLRYAKEIAAFEAADRSSPPAHGQVIFAGASSLRMWSTALADFAPYPILNRGFGGAYSTEVLGYLDRIVLPHRPRVVVYQAGGNDIWAGDPPAAAVDRARRVVQRLRSAQPGLPVVILAAPLAPVRRAKWEAFAEFNRGAAALAKDTPGVWFVDINPALNQPDGEPRPETYLKDALHPSAAGYAAMAKLIRPALDAAWKAAEKGR